MDIPTEAALWQNGLVTFYGEAEIRPGRIKCADGLELSVRVHRVGADWQTDITCRSRFEPALRINSLVR